MGGNLVFVTGQTKPITVLRAGSSPGALLTLVGRIIINYPGSWLHPNSALGLRPTPGQTNSYDLLFQLGSDSNFAVTTRTATLTNDSIPGATGVLPGDSFYLLTITDHGTNVTATNLTQIAKGLRNPAGFAFHSATGDLYFQDNGIDGLVDANEPLSADELNFIARSDLGGVPENFGFPANYTAYRTGTIVGGAGIQPLIAFQPLPDPLTGHESEGANDIVSTAASMPAGPTTRKTRSSMRIRPPARIFISSKGSSRALATWTVFWRRATRCSLRTWSQAGTRATEPAQASSIKSSPSSTQLPRLSARDLSGHKPS
ncbi:MAG: hypothetical protein DMG26_21560 [Acidobacteria bacterium]|nr:MAG: hypothetical protein DMG26_21560 [Acidobacteriota bacterium]